MLIKFLINKVLKIYKFHRYISVVLQMRRYVKQLRAVYCHKMVAPNAMYHVLT